MLRKNTHNQLRDSLLQGLLYVEKFKRSEFAMNEALAARWLGLTRKQLKPIYQKFKNNCKFSDAELKAKREQIEHDFEIAMAGGAL
jgi:CRISPR/Cas system CSM-associated protein Csm2 small subunit